MTDGRQDLSQNEVKRLSNIPSKEDADDCSPAKRKRVKDDDDGDFGEGSQVQLYPLCLLPQEQQQQQQQQHEEQEPKQKQQQQQQQQHEEQQEPKQKQQQQQQEQQDEQQQQQHHTVDEGMIGMPVTFNSDKEYFRCYSTIQVHEEMLSDTVRTRAYRWAILKNYPQLYKRSVLDVGAGTGILSIFAAQAGARRVYAIEASDMAKYARKVVMENKMEDKVEVKQQRVEEIELPEKVDAIISEWMGYCLFFESMLPSVLQARDKFLKVGGLMFPCQASLYLAPIHDEDYLHRLAFWGEVKDWYKVSMDSMTDAARACLTADADVRVVGPEAVQAHAVQVSCLDLMQVSATHLERVQSTFTFKCFGHSTVTGFITWFTVTFPGGYTLSTSPYLPETHWAQTIFNLRQSLPVEQDTEIKGTFDLTPQKHSHRCMQVKLDFSVNSKSQYCQTFNLSNVY